MKKKIISAIVIGFSCVLLGSVLIGIGFFTGGVEKLSKISEPEQITKDYSDLSSIHLELLPQSVLIQESPDQQFHVTYLQSKNNLFAAPLLVEKEKELVLSATNQPLKINGLLQLFGEILSRRNRTNDAITIQIPKNKQLEKLSGTSYLQISIENTQIKEVDISGAIYLSNVQINSGKIASHSTFAEQSTLKNVTITSQASPVQLEKTQLENVSIKDYLELNASKLTLKGQNTFIPSKYRLSVTNLDVTDQTLQDLNWNVSNRLDEKSLAVDLGYEYSEMSDKEREQAYKENTYLQEQLQQVGIFVRDKYAKLPVSSSKDGSRLLIENKDHKQILTIEATNATINIRTPH